MVLELTQNAHNVRNLSERLLFTMLCRLMLAFRIVDGDDLVWDLFFLEDGSDPTSAGRQRRTVDFKDHPGGGCESLKKAEV
jgi:hypothetical protein